MTRLVVDASIAVKWVVTEAGTAEAVSLLSYSPLVAPDLLIAQCANILWKKVARFELAPDEALMAARLIQQSDIELYPMRSLLEPAAQLAINLNHSAQDCLYLALAIANDWRFVTADRNFVAKVRRSGQGPGNAILSLKEAAAMKTGSTPPGASK